jgi:GNAT superfamily N-acetyltransferase/RimJ/RimL family protein N-acetyltransferase
MQVRQVTGADEIARWHAVFERGWLHERPWEMVLPLAHFQALFAKERGSQVDQAFAAYDGEDVVGAGYVTIALESNTDKVQFTLAVPPEHRRRGAGRALVDHCVERARDAGGTYAITFTSYPFEERETHGFRRFAEAVGLSLDIDEVHRVLRLPVDASLLQKLADDAAEHHAAYRIETWVDGISERYLDSWLETYNQLSQDAPSGEVPWVAAAYSRASHLDEMEFLRSTGRTRYSTVAISPDDEVVAYSDLMIPSEPGKVQQWGTLVRRDHRGHRLGTAVKVLNLQAVQRDRPDLSEVHTVNAEVNASMIGINEVLGFEAMAVSPCFYMLLR